MRDLPQPLGPGAGGTPPALYLEDLSGHGRWGLVVDGGVDGRGGSHRHPLLLHVVHHHLLLHALPLGLLLRLLLHQLHPQADAGRHGAPGGWDTGTEVTLRGGHSTSAPAYFLQQGN